MIKDLQKEEEFYLKKFKWSYSSLNKLLFSPSLFYKDYILWDREVRTDKHLIEGKLIHCLLFEAENVNEKFNIVPGKAPSDSVRKVLKDMALHTDAETLVSCDDFVILDSLKELNLYQSLKADESRIAKIRTEDNEPYWKFIGNSNVDVVDQDTLLRCKEKVDILKENKDVMSLFNEASTDFDLDPIESFSEKYLKTTGKTISDFKETIDFYNYWLQAAIYSKLVYDSLGDDRDDYNIVFKFVVIDLYKQVYVFDVLDDTLSAWAGGLSGALKTAKYHYENKNYSLPYDFLVNKIKL